MYGCPTWNSNDELCQKMASGLQGDPYVSERFFEAV